MEEDTSKLPERIVTAMRELLVEARTEAAKHDSPGDGSSIGIGQGKVIDGGHWHPMPVTDPRSAESYYGWTLQVSLLEDERMWEGPQLIVYAYSGSQLAKGSIVTPMTWTGPERLALDLARLKRLKDHRAQLDEAIHKLANKLGVSS